MARVLLLVPAVLCAGFVGLAFFGMARDDPDGLPSTRVGQQAPALGSAGLPGVAPAGDAELRAGSVTLVNFWATWCPPCRAEHPVLMQMAAEGVRIVGVNIRDNPDHALRYLAEEGNPFLGVATDPDMRTSIDWGVTAPPETFIIGGDGTVLFRFIGPLIGSDYEQRFLPAFRAAVADGAAG